MKQLELFPARDPTDFTYTIERRRRRTATITVKPDNRVIVAVPMRMAKKRARAFIVEHTDWIRKKIAENLRAQRYYKVTDYESGDLLSFMGRHHPLDLREGKARGVSLEDGALVVHTPTNLERAERDALIREQLETWYMERAAEVITERIRVYAKRLRVRPAQVKIKRMRSLWGSCTRRRTLNFNWKIILGPLWAIDYLVAHELCHLRHPNHSKTYWNLMQSVMPDCRERNKWLSKNHGLLGL